MEKSGIWYWVKRLQVQIGMFLGISVVYSLILYNGAAETLFQKIAGGTLYYMIIFGIITVMIIQTSNMLAILPVAISMGSTRKSAVISMQVLPLLGSLENLLICTLLSFLALGSVDMQIELQVLYLGLLLFSAAIGQYLNCMHIKLGEKKGFYYVAMVIGVILATGMGCGFLIPAFFRERSGLYLPSGAYLGFGTVAVITCVTGVVLYIGSFFLFNYLMRDYEVKM